MGAVPRHDHSDGLGGAAKVALADPGRFAAAVAAADPLCDWIPDLVAKLAARHRRPSVGWDPWPALWLRSDVVLEWHVLGDDWDGMTWRTPTGWVIAMDHRLDRVAARCTLAHELVHVERGIVTGTDATMEREEAIVRAETARRLVPEAELISVVDATADAVASAFDVTEDVATDALAQLCTR